LPPAVTIHNLVFQARLMGRARDAIIDGTFPDYLRSFFAGYYGDKGYPEWCVNALRSVGVDLLEGQPNAKVMAGNTANWDRPE
jgi:queuine tRNA-ribosyltransferase catalytic subunit